MSRESTTQSQNWRGIITFLCLKSRLHLVDLCLPLFGIMRRSLVQPARGMWWTASHVLSQTEKSQRATCRHKYYSSPSTRSRCNLKLGRVLLHDGTALWSWLRSCDGRQTQTLMGCHRGAVQTQGWGTHAKLFFVCLDLDASYFSPSQKQYSSVCLKGSLEGFSWILLCKCHVNHSWTV